LWNGPGEKNDQEFHTVQDVLGHLAEIWNDLTSESIQSAFLESQIRLNWVIENDGECHSEQSKKNGNLFGRHSKGILSARRFGPRVPKDDEAIRSDIRTVGRMRRPFGFGDPHLILR
jgi:hypothetical protein